MSEYIYFPELFKCYSENKVTKKLILKPLNNNEQSAKKLPKILKNSQRKKKNSHLIKIQ